MRVLIVYPKFYVYGGAELLIVRLCNYLTKRGIENTILTTSMLSEIQVDLTGTGVIMEKNRFSNLPGEIFALHRGVRNRLNDFDVINVHNFPAELSIFPHRKPVVWMCNEPELYLNRNLSIFNWILFPAERLLVKHYMKNVVVSDEFNAGRFMKIYNIKPQIINYGIDFDFFNAGRDRLLKNDEDRFNLSKNFVVLQVGMLTPYKNQMASLKAVHKLKDNIPNIKLVLAGLGAGEYVSKYKKMIEKYVNDNNLKENVLLTGHLSRNAIRDLFHTCDVVLHPIKHQGGWLTPFEALCAKKPIIVSNEMTASAIIGKEKIGVVTDNYADSVLDIYLNPDKYHDIAKRGQQWVKENLSWDRFGDEMLKVFNKALRVEE